MKRIRYWSLLFHYLLHAVYFESRHNDSVDFIWDAFRSDLEIEGGVLAKECAELYA